MGTLREQEERGAWAGKRWVVEKPAYPKLPEVRRLLGLGFKVKQRKQLAQVCMGSLVVYWKTLCFLCF